MKPEPMRTKGKRRIEMTTAEWIGRLVMPVNTFPKELKEGCGEILKLREEKEIISAVEWLKEQIDDVKNPRDWCISFDELNQLIDEAFEDVTQNTINE